MSNSVKRSVTKILAALAACVAVGYVMAQTTSPRPVNNGSLQSRQFVVTNLSLCTSAKPCYPTVAGNPNQKDTGDVYFGQALNNVASAGQVVVGTGAFTLVITDGNGTVWISAPQTAAVSGTIMNSLDSMHGLYMQGGFTVYCSDSASGANCAAGLLQIQYQR
jgi:hypothetical protein